jgi:hypothetical protein
MCKDVALEMYRTPLPLDLRQLTYFPNLDSSYPHMITWNWLLGLPR